MFYNAFSKDVHTFSQWLNIPYNTLTENEKRIIYKSIEDVISPKLHEVLRNGWNKPDSFIAKVNTIYQDITEYYNFNNIEEFVKKYIWILEKKHILQQWFNKLSWNTNFSSLMSQAIEIEVAFFAYSMFTKKYSEGLINYLSRAWWYDIEKIAHPSKPSFYQAFHTDLYNYSQNNKSEDIIKYYFNNEQIFFDEYLLKNNINSQPINIQNNEINIWDNKLLKQTDTLLWLDHIVDKYLTIKNIYLHDLVSYLQLYQWWDISYWNIEKAIEILYDKNMWESKNNKYLISRKIFTQLKWGISGDVLYNKSSNISILNNFWYNIPKGLTFSQLYTKWLYDNSLWATDKEEITKTLQAYLWDNIIIRSNFLWEDWSSSSFAWHFMSVVNSSGDTIIDNTYNVLHSWDAFINHVTPGVLLQEFIEWDVSGVAFIQDNKIIIEYVLWTNMKLVDGSITPDHVEIDINQSSKDIPEILKNHINELYKIKTIFNDNVDIEFTIKDNKMYILQSRSITKKIEWSNYKKIESNIEWLHGKLLSSWVCEWNLVPYSSNYNNIIWKNSKHVLYTNTLDTKIIPHLYEWNIVGIVTTTWWQLAHLSIVARELQIPVIHLNNPIDMNKYKKIHLNKNMFELFN